MRRSPLRSWLLLALACLLLPWTATDARRKKNSLTRSSLPAWVQEAAARAPRTSEYDAVILLEEKIVEPLAGGGVQTLRRLAVKVYGANGLDLMSDYGIYYAKGDQISLLRAWSLQPDDSVVALDPKEHTTDRPAVSDAGFNDLFQRIVEIPGMRVGAVIALEYGEVEQMDTGADSWTFGSPSRPTLLSRFELRTPNGWTWTAAPERADGLERSITDRGEAFVGRDLAPLKRVPARPDSVKLLPQVWFGWRDGTGQRGYADWDAVAAHMRRLSDPGLDEPGEAAELAARFKPEGPDSLLESISSAFEFASRDVRYVSIDIGLGIGAGWTAASPSSVCSKRYGDCKDKSYLMRALTEPWGARAFAVLVRTRNRGPLPRGIPSPGTFNHCIVAIALPDGVGENLWNVVDVEGIGRVALLDATARDSSPWDLPWMDQGTTGLLIHPGGGVLIELPVQPSTASAAHRVFDISIDAAGAVLDAEFDERWSGNSASQVRSYYLGLSEEEISTAVLREAQDRIPGSQISHHELHGLDDIRASVRETTGAEGGRLGKKIGNLLILEPGKAGYGVLNSTLPEPPREWNYVLGRPREETLKITIRLPEGWVPEEIRPKLEVDSKHVRAQASWHHSDGALVYERTVSLTGVEVVPDDYAEFRESMSQIRSEDRQAVVLVSE